MRAFLVLLVIAGIVALAVVAATRFADDAAPAPDAARAPAAPEVHTAHTAHDGQRTTGAGAPRVAATRTGSTAPRGDAVPPPPLADAPTAWLRVVERDAEQPVAGAPVRRLQGGADLTFTDEHGLAAVPLREPEQLAVVVDGYLLRLVPTRLGTTAAEPQAVVLVRDDWSIVRRFEFTTPTGAAAGTVFVRFRPRGSIVTTVPGGDPIVQRAWGEHTMLAARAVAADVPVQLGTWNEDRVHALEHGDAVRFTGTGAFTLEAATTSGLVARQDVQVATAPRTGAPPIRVVLQPGAFVQGTVVGAATGAPVVAATLTLQGGEPLGLVATTAADGAFRLGPLWPQPVVLHVHHADHEPLAFGPVPAPSTDARVVVQALPATTIRGRVVARGSGAPIVNATVAWHPPGGVVVTAITDASGTFTLRATGTLDAQLAITALGYMPYAELVTTGAPFADYALWPATTAERLAHGMTALLDGIVTDARGLPVDGAEVRWEPSQRGRPATAAPGRRVLQGGALALSLGARSGSDGAFRLETDRFGPGRLVLQRGGTALDTTATAGQTVQGLRLQQ